ncbi:Hypothetical protein PHPALM_17896 [Phytophthora palmivora]|uniref:Carbohydrate-binding protein n=1 Tax=Phytophthora palmivora TaxID=4796 RepID=A0A2P4XL33_9STRA|nr:Hypothetical protein PHPALM_17896 [Phytophthora palmivora]
MKTGLAPLVVCVALLISSASAGGETKTGVGASKTSTGLDAGDDYLGSVDPNQKNSYDFKYVNKESDTSERDGTLGDSVVAGKETDATAPSAPVTLDPELKKESGIDKGAISTDASKATGTGAIDSGTPPATPAPQTKMEGDPKASKGQWTPVPTSASDNKESQSTDAPQSTPASTPTSDTDASTTPASPPTSDTGASKETESTPSTPAPTQPSQDDQSTDDDDQSSGDDESAGDDQSDASDTPQSTPAVATTDSSQSNNQWTPAPNQQNNQQPTQAPNNEAPQPTQPTQAPNNEAPQPTQPSQDGQNTFWQGQWNGNPQAPASNGNQNSTWQGNWGSGGQTQNQPTPAPTTASGSSQDSNRDSPVPTEPTSYESTPATAPSPPVSNCKVRRRSRH